MNRPAAVLLDRLIFLAGSLVGAVGLALIMGSAIGITRLDAKTVGFGLALGVIVSLHGTAILQKKVKKAKALPYSNVPAMRVPEWQPAAPAAVPIQTYIPPADDGHPILGSFSDD